MAGLQGLSIGETARLRGIKSTTIMGYLANAILCGHAYPWPCAGVTQADIAKATPVLEDLLKTAGTLYGSRAQSYLSLIRFCCPLRD